MDATASRPPDLRYSKLHFIFESARFKMDVQEFKLQTEEFMMIANYLSANARDSLPAALEIISKSTNQAGIAPQEACEMQIRKIGFLIGNLGVIYNRLLASIDMPPTFPVRE